MQKESILYGIIGLLAGSLITIVITSNAVNNNNTGLMRMMGIHTNNQPQDEDQSSTSDMHKMSNGSMMNNSQMGMQGGMTMEDMTNNLKGKTGDEFDKAFVVEMIEHHQGAIDMANLAKQNAKHDEIKTMAEAIISAQTKEIIQMKEWQKAWGY